MGWGGTRNQEVLDYGKKLDLTLIVWVSPFSWAAKQMVMIQAVKVQETTLVFLSYSVLSF